METLCKIRDIYRLISEFENSFVDNYNLCLNEGMLLCSLLKNKHLNSSEIAKYMGLTFSNASKVIRSIENKGLIERTLGEHDKRQMYFSLTKEGRKKINEIMSKDIEIPEDLERIINL